MFRGCLRISSAAHTGLLGHTQAVHHPDAIPLDAPSLRADLAHWFGKHGRSLPWRDNCSPYEVMVSEFMLQQTQVISAIPYFKKWLLTFPNVQALASASEEAVLREWQGLGYYSRARNLRRAAMAIVERFGGSVPSDPSLLKSLPGIGPYSAGAIAAFAFDHPVAAVDANIARVLARIANLHAPIDRPSGSKQIWKLAASLLPAKNGGRLHTSALMELGALVCLPKKPKCLMCPVRQHCRATDAESLPRKAPRRATLAVMETAGWCTLNNQVLLEQQTGRRSRGLWKLPPMPAPPDEEPLFQTVYPFTHHKITLNVHAAAPPQLQSPNQRWFAISTVLDEAAMPAGHRRALLALLAKTTQTAPELPQPPSPTFLQTSSC